MKKLFTHAKSLQKQYFTHITGAACAANFLLGTGKLITGIISLSFFTCTSALYTYSMVIAKTCALKGMKKEREKQYAYYRLTGIILIIASFFYSVYAGRFLAKPENPHYNIYFGISIATFTFTEIGLNIRGVLIGLLMGSISTMIGIFMLVCIKKIKKNNEGDYNDSHSGS